MNEHDKILVVEVTRFTNETYEGNFNKPGDGDCLK